MQCEQESSEESNGDSDDSSEHASAREACEGGLKGAARATSYKTVTAEDDNIHYRSVTHGLTRKGIVNFQCADVSRPLMSVSRSCDEGNCVVFTATGGYVVDKQGLKTAFRRKNNVYVLDMWTKVEAVAEETKPEKTEAQSFPRQGQ